jgi:putative ABC transport system ATP-binding protein
MPAIVEMKDARKDYQAGTQVVHALRGVDLDIQAGEFTSIAGPSGSGKTTLLNLIGCLDAPSSGKVWVAGEDIAEKSRDERAELRRHKIGFIFQTFNLVPVLSAFENVEFPLSLLPGISHEERQERVELLLELVGLADMMTRRPAELSGGQQQRVAIARALVKKPVLVLADEPTANLDSKTGENVLDLMKKINAEENATFIFSTHDKLVMDYARRLIILRDGAITEDRKGK